MTRGFRNERSLPKPYARIDRPDGSFELKFDDGRYARIILFFLVPCLFLLGFCLFLGATGMLTILFFLILLTPVQALLARLDFLTEIYPYVEAGVSYVVVLAAFLLCMLVAFRIVLRLASLILGLFENVHFPRAAILVKPDGLVFARPGFPLGRREALAFKDVAFLGLQRDEEAASLSGHRAYLYAEVGGERIRITRAIGLALGVALHQAILPAVKAARRRPSSSRRSAAARKRRAQKKAGDARAPPAFSEFGF